MTKAIRSGTHTGDPTMVSTHRRTVLLRLVLAMARGTAREIVERGLSDLAGRAHGGHGLFLAHAVLHAIGDGLRVELLGLLNLIRR